MPDRCECKHHGVHWDAGCPSCMAAQKWNEAITDRYGSVTAEDREKGAG